MSVLANDRNLSKFEAIVHSEELHTQLRDLMQRNFGVKDLRRFAYMQCAYGIDNVEDYEKYYWRLMTHKKNIDKMATLMTSNVRAAYSTFPSNLHECEIRRDYQNAAIVNCEQIIKEIQRVVTDFNLDINKLKPFIVAIDREIDLIKGWRQRDNKIRKRLQKGNI